MEPQKNALRSIFGKAAMATAALSAFLLFGGAVNAKANDRYDCARRVDRAEWKLRDAIEDHGPYSRQARHWRHELREEHERCERDSRRWRERDWRERRRYDDRSYDRYEDRSYDRYYDRY